jgi:nicotinate-nucleotide adenylyltransferase
MKTIKTGCLFGSFNPIHIGHLMVAEFMATRTDLDEVQLIVSPQNPLKQQVDLAQDVHRLAMAKLATEDNNGLVVNDLEFQMAKPSYTIVTLDELARRHPDRHFVVIMGSDNLAILKQWRQWERIISDYGCYVYNRPGYPPGDLEFASGVRYFDAPLINVSSTYIRNSLHTGLSTRYLIPKVIGSYIRRHDLYPLAEK